MLAEALATGIPVRAQEPLLRHLTVKDGLASNTVYSAFQDRNGFLWFCTNQGISRFDGHSFDNFTTEDGLPDSEVFQALEDPEGRIWLTSYSGKICFIRNGRVCHAGNSRLCRALETDPLFQKIRQDEGHTAPPVLLRGFRNLSQRLRLYAYASAAEVICFRHSGGKGLFYTHGSVCAIEDDRVTLLKEKGNTPFYEGERLFMSYSSNTISGTEIPSRNSAAPATAYQSVPVSKIYYITAKDDSTLWLGTANGVWSVGRAFNRHDIRNVLLPDRRVSCIRKDADNNYWLGTLDDGIYLLPASLPAVYKYAGSGATSIATFPSQALAIGTGLQHIGWIDSTRRAKYYLPGGPDSRSRVTAVMPLSDTHLLVGTDDKLYAVRADPARMMAHYEVLLKSTIKDLYRQGDSVFYACTAGAGVMDRSGRGLRYWKHRTTAIAVSGQTVWLGTLRGAYTYEPGKGVRHFGASPALSKSRIVDIGIAPAGDVLLLTHQAGIFSWDGKALQHIREGDGLSSNICRKILTDSQGRIWVSTNGGLDRLVRVRGKYTVVPFPLSDGPAENDLQDFALAAGKLYICCEEGIVRLDTLQDRGAPPLRTVITSVTAGDSTVAFPDRIALSYKNAGVAISYTAILFGNSRNLTYRYVLEGRSGDTVTTRLASVLFDALAPGDYAFKVWAKAGNGIWTREPAILSFSIAPPFWYSIWFRLAVLLATSALVYVLMKKRIDAVRTAEQGKTALNKRMAGLKMQALRAQINPHFIFNALNAIQNYYSINDERSANRYMSMFSRLIRQTLTHSNDNWIGLSEEVEMLRAYMELEKMRFKSSFRYRIEVAPGIDAENTRIPAMMLQPFVENAINHGLRHLRDRQGTVAVCFSAQADGILCVIEDDGVGFAQAAAIENKSNIYPSLGMDITAGRLDTMNLLYNTRSAVQVIHKNEVPPFEGGTRIEVTLPIQPTINE